MPPDGWRVADGDGAAYARAFSQVQAGLRRGDSFLLNLTGRTAVDTALTPWQMLLAARAPYKLYWPGRFICFSPETFVRVENDVVRTYPMKGTASAAVSDAKARLLADYKETCEHYTIVDLMRNDLSRVAMQVAVERFRYAERIETPAGGLWQTSSEVSGRLPADWRATLGDWFLSLLPAGSISGAPKAATVALIRAAERRPRDYYTGVFGYFDGRNLDSAVAIRFMETEAGQPVSGAAEPVRAAWAEDGGPEATATTDVSAAAAGVHRYYFRSGGGITIHSRCEDEYRELREKVALPLASASPPEFIETIRLCDGRWERPMWHERRVN
ncbi:MAG: aminodeoxychorismate synthase component I, partial [Bacteroidales bacterium]|nr:aminodeoxychorismate synthase component I [Bacteroidales bacterium]